MIIVKFTVVILMTVFFRQRSSSRDVKTKISRARLFALSAFGVFTIVVIIKH